MPINQELLEILACPKCHEPVKLTEDETGLVCHRCFRIEDDIPIMLIDEATPLEP